MIAPSTVVLASLLQASPSSVPLAGGGTLRWSSRGDGCPEAEEVAAMIDQHLGPRPEAEAVEVDATARPDSDGRWRLELRIGLASGEASRTLDADDCQSAAQTAALAVALAAGPGRVPPPPVVEPEPPPRTEPEPTEDPKHEPTTPDAPVSDDPSAPTRTEPDLTISSVDAPAEPTPSDETEDRPPAPPRRPSWALGLGGGLTGGHVPRLGAAVTGWVGLVGRRWEVALRADHLVRRRLGLPQRADAGATLSITTGGAQAGPVLRPGPLELPLLVGVGVGAIRARGFGSDRDRTRAVPWATVILGPAIRWAPAPRWVLGLRAEATIALVRHTFTVEPRFSLAPTGLMAGRALATVAIRLP